VKHRNDIDGLRAVAVLPVVVFHAKLPIFSGGFCGVDVFFVISGFLIGSIVVNEINDGGFSIIRFWERRARRILPALFAMIAVVSVFSYIYFYPTELVRYGNGALAAIFSASNFYFYSKTGYFGLTAQAEPLLHTWSLAVEEQFYLFLPLFMLGIRKFAPNAWKQSLLAVTIISFLVSVYYSYAYPTKAFYLPDSRAWELLLGTMLALGLHPKISSIRWANIIGLVGLGLILVPMLVYTEATPFPGLAALAPCMGTVFVIVAGEQPKSVSARVLSLRPIVFIGLISYSVYLWHWPLIVFQNTDSAFFQTLSPPAVKAALVASSLVLGSLSWWLIERPFRYGPLALRQGRLFAAAGATALAIAAAVELPAFAQGFPARFTPEAIRAASYSDYDVLGPYRKGVCFLEDGDSIGPIIHSGCLAAKAGQRNYLLYGDSLAADTYVGLHRNFPSVNFEEATSSGCTPIIESGRQSNSVRCRALTRYMFDRYLPVQHVDGLILAANWRFRDLKPLQDTLDWASRRGIRVVLFGPKLVYDNPLSRLVAAGIQRRDPLLAERHLRSDSRALERAMSALASRNHVTYFSYFSLLCASGRCENVTDKGVPIAWDAVHLTADGSDYVFSRAVKTKVLELR
jgi:peptidoglycan/LPS O-acetylase OafA/YrhL